MIRIHPLRGPYSSDEAPPILPGAPVPFGLLDLPDRIVGIDTLLVRTNQCQDPDCDETHRYLDVILMFEPPHRAHPGEQITLRLNPATGTRLAAMLSKHLTENDAEALVEALDEVTEGRSVNGEPSAQWYRD